MVAIRGGYWMARGWHYTKLSLSSALPLSFSGMCILLLFLAFCRFCFVSLCFFFSLVGAVDVLLISLCPVDHVPDWQSRILLGIVEARSVNAKKTTTSTTPKHAGSHLSVVAIHPVRANTTGGNLGVKDETSLGSKSRHPRFSQPRT